LKVTSEGARKLIHIAIGFFALTLRWLTTWQAAAVALFAFLFNWLILPRVGGKLIAREQHGTDRGILIYPLAVFALIVAFPTRPEAAGAVWAILAFGDGVATLVGRNIGKRPLPWNPDKSVAGTLAFAEAGLPAAYLAWVFIGSHGPMMLHPFLALLIVVVACTIVESLQLNLEDNITVPLTGGVAIALLMSVDRVPLIALNGTDWIWLLVNGLLAVAGYAAASVNLSGMIGGFALGAILIVFAGWELYVVLLAFFVIGTALTKLGYARKAARGLAQEGGGRRGFNHAFSNVGVASILALLISFTFFDAKLLWIAAMASLATAAADTSGSEIGQLVGRRAFLPYNFRSVPVGTEGAVSVEGTMAGLAGGFVVAFVGSILMWRHFAGESFSGIGGLMRSSEVGRTTAIVTAAAFIGSWIESLAGNWNRTRARAVPNGALNFFNTLVGALLAAGISMLTGWP